MLSRVSLLSAVLSVFLLAPAHAGKVKEYRKERAELGKMLKEKKVSVVFGEDEIGEYFRLNVTGKLIDKLDDLELKPDNSDVYSNIKVSEVDGKRVMSMTVYTVDMERWTPGENLQTSEGRSFPNFYGARHETLWGFALKGNKYQLYLDPGTGLFGVYMNVDGVGNVINKVNNFKNKVPVLKDLIPNINAIGAGIKIKKKKVAKIYALSHDENTNERGGVLVLVDYNQIRAMKGQ